MLPFQNRLRKMARHYDKWARRRGLEAYRVYDADLDEYPVTVDRYAERIYVAIYGRRGHDPTPAEWEVLTTAYRTAIAATLETETDRLHFKLRRRQAGSDQYERLATDRREFPVVEHGHRFLVNLTDYLDTGLFLDHRRTRQLVAERAAGKRLLNLFAYTCSFGVYGAAAGAVRVDNLDLSNTYLDWGRRNFEVNGIDPAAHGFLRADGLAWLARPVEATYDLIVLDPPTFSNSKAMREVLDTQRDHVRLVNDALRRLAPGGELFFSTNYRRFRLATEELAGTAREITRQTLPPDFRRRNLHRCWIIRHGDR